MPVVTYGDYTKGVGTAVSTDVDLKYVYPEGLDLRPNSKLHKKIKEEVLVRVRESRNQMEKRFESWNEIDETLTAYVKLSDYEKELKKKASTTPSTKRPISIVFPYSYAIMETVLTYLVMAFMQDPILRYEGVSPEDTIGTILLEKVIDLQCNKTKVALNLHTMNRDGIVYGVGPVAPMWRQRWGIRTSRVATGAMFGPEFERIEEEDLLFEGNALENIDPYLYLPDPNVPVDRIQDGAFVGWIDIDNYYGLLDEERSDDEVFNVKYLTGLVGKHSQFAEKQSKRQEFIGGHRLERTEVSKRVDVINMYINIVPKEWELGTSEYPEKWLFSLASDEIVIRAKPLGLNHNMYPITVAAPEYDGYSSTPISRLEMLKGMQSVLDWLFSSHIANVRKAINDMFVVDPYLININDLKDPEPGKLIRMRRPAWGRGVKDAVVQLSVNDITQRNIQDASFIIQWMGKMVGADESMMGAQRTSGPERKTGKEFQGTRGSAVSRMERVAKIIGLQAMQDIGYMFASHTQQLMSRETFVKATGRWQEDLMKEFRPKDRRVKVDPMDLLIDYDVMVRDGSIPGGNFSEGWIQLFDVAASHPEVLRKLDFFRVFTHVARNMGAKNVHEFERLEQKIVPDEQVADQAKRGNLIPIGDAM